MKKIICTILLMSLLVIGCSCGEAALPSGVIEEEYDGMAFDEETHPYFAKLDVEQKYLYEKLYNKLDEGKDTVVGVTGMGRKDAMKALEAVWLENPEFYWLDYDMSYCRHSEGGGWNLLLCCNDLQESLAENRAKVNDVVEDILAGAEGMSDVEAEKYFHDYICENVSFKKGRWDQNVYSALIEGKTVCAGYARTMQYLMKMQGIMCYYVEGYPSDEEEWEEFKEKWDNGVEDDIDDACHAWNVVEIDGKYYNLDVCWDDIEYEGQQTRYDYFNFTDKVREEDFIRYQGTPKDELPWDEYFRNVIPECNTEWKQ